jgi:hypothetical protein
VGLLAVQGQTKKGLSVLNYMVTSNHINLLVRDELRENQHAYNGLGKEIESTLLWWDI